MCCLCFRVVGPAVTFKVSPNSQNVTTADVANVAGRFFFFPLLSLALLTLYPCLFLRLHPPLLSNATKEIKDRAIICGSAAHLSPLRATLLRV